MAKKPAHSSKKKKSTSTRPQSFWSVYAHQRDEMYKAHPRIRILLGLLIVAFAMAIGVMYYNMNVVYIGLSLDQQYGIRYPYVDNSVSGK